MAKRPQQANPWDQARKTHLFRVNAVSNLEECLDRGVNYFVLKLEAVGARPLFSCEGHPFGFYILFEASLETALLLRSAGFFDVCLEGQNRWSLRLRSNELGRYSHWTETTKRRCLRHAALSWEQVVSAPPQNRSLL